MCGSPRRRHRSHGRVSATTAAGSSTVRIPGPEIAVARTGPAEIAGEVGGLCPVVSGADRTTGNRAQAPPRGDGAREQEVVVIAFPPGFIRVIAGHADLGAEVL